MFKINNITTELMVDDMKKSIDFYQNNLGFVVEISVPEKEPFFVVLKNASVELMLYKREQFSEEIPKFKEMNIGGSIALYMNVEDINAVYDILKKKVKVIQTLHTTDYGSIEFSFEDNSGYVVMLTER